MVSQPGRSASAKTWHERGWLQQEGSAGSSRAFARLSTVLRFQEFGGFHLLVDCKSTGLVLGLFETESGFWVLH